jgi:hypothetical protein
MKLLEFVLMLTVMVLCIAVSFAPVVAILVWGVRAGLVAYFCVVGLLTFTALLRGMFGQD